VPSTRRVARGLVNVPVRCPPDRRIVAQGAPTGSTVAQGAHNGSEAIDSAARSLAMGHIPRNTRRFSIGRPTIALTLAVMLVAPGAAVARRIVTGSTKTAIVRTVPTALPTPQRCLVVYVTTEDGGDWATMSFNNAMLHSCIRWAADGVAIAHRVNGRWRYVASGSADIPCGRLGIPVAVRKDLTLPCTVSPPPQRSGRFPVIGCNARGADPSPAPIAAYAPSRCYLSRVGPGAPGYGDTVNLQSIDHVQWAHWGAATATGRGDIVFCGTGCTTVPASMTVYDLTTSQLAGGKAYTWLRVSFSASYPTKHTATVTYNVRPVPEHGF
jgi:hypothetical protein